MPYLLRALVILAAVLGAVSPASSALAQQGRNVLLIIADDFGLDVATFYPETAGRLPTNPPPPPMPNMTRLAREGVLFRNAWANMECSPTRATIATGRHGFRTGVGAYVNPTRDAPTLPLSEFIIPEAITAARGTSVVLAHVGKWHLTLPSLRDPNTHGWPYYSGPYQGGALSNYYDWRKVVNGVSSQSKVYATTDQVNDAVRRIGAARARGKPYIIKLAFNAPHQPYHKPPNSLHSRDSLPPANDVQGNARPYYEAMIEAMDTEIGRLLRSVDLSTTTVIFIGDNGTPGAVKASGGQRAAKSSIYEGGIHVPLLIAGAGVASRGRVAPHIVNSVDLYPTILALIGIDFRTVVPAGRKIDGVSLVPILNSASAGAVRQFAYSEHFPLRYDENYKRAIRDVRYKLVRFPGRSELYDLVNDPRETKDLLLAPLTAEARAAFDRLSAALDDLLAPR
jgi:arylsulfatase B